MKITVHLYTQSQPIILEHIKNTYQKGDLYCVLSNDNIVTKFPIQHIFRILEEDESK